MAKSLNDYQFEKLFREYYTPLYFYVLNIIKNEEDSKDIVSSIFEYIWNRCIRSPMEIDQFVPLLFTLAKNKCTDYVRRQEMMSKHYKNIIIEYTADNIDMETKEREEMVEKMISVIDSLPKQTKRVAQKCFLEDKKYKEVAEDMNISTNTIKTHVMKAFRTLRETFGVKKDQHKKK